MAEIDVQRQDDDTFAVAVREGGSRSNHTVTLDDEYHRSLTGGAGSKGEGSKEDLIRRSFEFLLQRESKESILASFHLEVIARYSPEYERVMQRG